MCLPFKFRPHIFDMLSVLDYYIIISVEHYAAANRQCYSVSRVSLWSYLLFLELFSISILGTCKGV